MIFILEELLDLDFIKLFFYINLAIDLETILQTNLKEGGQ
jgi:hypothetical protein